MHYVRLPACLGLFSVVCFVACGSAGGGGGGLSGTDDGGFERDAALDMPDAEFVATDAEPDGCTNCCGGERCFAGQTCSEQHCEFSCTGIMVPGDYATIESALSALSGGDPVTICVAPGRYPSVTLSSNITLVGASRDVVSFAGISAFSRIGRAVARGVSADVVRLSSTSGGHLRLEACRVLRGVEASASTSIGAKSVSVELDGCDIGGAGGTATRARPVFNGASAWIVVENSYIHDASVGAAGIVSLRNSTLVGTGTGTGVHSDRPSVVNCSISDFGIAFNFTGAPGVPAGYTNNALFNNTTNYAGAAIPGTGEVRGDPLWTTDSPPAPGNGSPLIGAALATKATATDYWGTPRVIPDIGAVQASSP